jgi:cell division protein FtsB
VGRPTANFIRSKQSVVIAMPKRIRRTRSTTRHKTKRTFKPPKFLRVLLVLMIVAVGIYSAYATALKVSRPYVISYGESKEIEKLKKQIAVATTENNQLNRDLSYLATPQGKEAEARKIGLVKKGETAIMVQQPDQSKLQLDRTQAMKETFWQTASKSLVKLFVKTPGK